MCSLITALPVSHSTDDEISGELFNSIKDAHSLCIKGVKSGSLSNEVLKRQQGEYLIVDSMFKMRDTGAWSLMIGCIMVSATLARSVLLIKKKSNRQNDWCCGEK